MPRINFANSGHQIGRAMSAQPTRARAFQIAAPDIFRGPPDHYRLIVLNAAIDAINRVVVQPGTISSVPGQCNAAFANLPRGRNFIQIWNDTNIWISYSGDPDPNTYGWSDEGEQELAITEGGFRNGWRCVAATIVHELAHLNGAPGGNQSHAAERTVYWCGFAAEYGQTIVGQMDRTSHQLWAWRGRTSRAGRAS